MKRRFRARNLRRRCFLSCVCLALLLIRCAAGATIDFREAPYAAVGDGTTDDRPALARALAAARPGDTVLVMPGDYRLDLTKAPLSVPAQVTIQGQAEKSRFHLTSSGGAEYREFLHLHSESTLEGLTVEREGDFDAVLFPLTGELNSPTLRDCRIDGHAERFPAHFCHALQVGNGQLKNLRLLGVTVEGCTYGLFQANEATGSVTGATVERSLFQHNTASDLEFNSPHGQMKDIVVRDCFFRDNLCPSASGGFAVGLANVTGALVEHCHIENYQSEALHVEDRAQEIHLTENTIVGGSLRQGNGVILVVNNARRVTIDHNFIDARPNTNKPHLILVTAGGGKFANPGEVIVRDNVLINGAATSSWYLQPGSGPEPTGNLVLPGRP